ncbi:Response regulator c-di-GMP phosphodiesterase, RpfG family, contains REC and HD-GYP domains [Marisediminitalea aggregata]|uniref:Response regulator c-di-GMP phosphodiesterase, RpfG family, contains REC and HD-GYP domains n=1 Tax=Marisediminitalea aggregata TaxID=634436 RepID=A0A1M5HZH1_9ALTE|nr:response regulator [Marisediminitalea aggregata]SHG21456.1 Response regulator c-di-GMP phosphodiesterase, RpfG family, contains REC and HD-GYP domains [Marisediminitalea aggregata]
MTDAQQTEQVKYQVLCVDDEQNILRAIKRALFSLDVDLTLVDSGEKALAVMKEKTIHVVISDMKMPGMTGAELLEQVAAHYPDTFRVVLTGFADIDATIKAVNQGRIHRYLQKPWDNQELINTIEEGLERIKLKDENTRLQKLTKLQNAKLKEVNNSLEQVVQKRTKQIKAALRRIEQRNAALEQVLFNVISINPDIDGKFAIEVSELATKLANLLECSKEETNVIRYACLIGEFGLLGLKPEHYRPAFNKLSYQQQKNYLSQTKLAKTILAPAEHLREVSDILEYQFEYYNGAGLYKLVATQIPIGARILAVARDYWRMVSGRITGQPMTPIEARVELKKHRNTRYDGNVLDILLNTKDIDKPSYIENRLSTEELKPGMVLSKNLYNESHILLLPEGHVFTDATIAKLAQYEREHNRFFDIAVERNGMEDATIG